MIAPEWLKQGKYWLIVCTEDVFREIQRVLHCSRKSENVYETKDFEIRVIKSLRSVRKNMIESEKTVIIVKVVKGQHSCYVEKLKKEELK